MEQGGGCSSPQVDREHGVVLVDVTEQSGELRMAPHSGCNLLDHTLCRQRDALLNLGFEGSEFYVFLECMGGTSC